jgi:hypothetical protein
MHCTGCQPSAAGNAAAIASAHRGVRPGLPDVPPAVMPADAAPRPSVTFEMMRVVWSDGYGTKGAGMANQIVLDPSGMAATERAMREAGDRVGDAPRGPVDSGERELDMIAESFDAAWGTGARRNARDCEVFGEQVQASWPTSGEWRRRTSGLLTGSAPP